MTQKSFRFKKQQTGMNKRKGYVNKKKENNSFNTEHNVYSFQQSFMFYHIISFIGVSSDTMYYIYIYIYIYIKGTTCGNIQILFEFHD